MRFSNITLAAAVAAATFSLGCAPHEAGAHTATPEVQAASVSQQSATPVETSTSSSTVTSASTQTQATAQTGAGAHPTPPVLDSLIKGTLPARGLYVFRFAANQRRLKHLIGIADSTEVNALIIDVKDEFGLNYEPTDPMVKKNAGTQVKARNLQ